MSGRLFLIHWKQAEAEEHADRLRALGWPVDVEAEDGARAARAILEDPPAAVVVYLTRLPSHGRHTAAYLRSRKGGADVPLIFVGGRPQAVEQTRAEVPNAFYLEADALPGTLESLLGSWDAS